MEYKIIKKIEIMIWNYVGGNEIIWQDNIKEILIKKVRNKTWKKKLAIKKNKNKNHAFVLHWPLPLYWYMIHRQDKQF